MCRLSNNVNIILFYSWLIDLIFTKFLLKYQTEWSMPSSFSCTNIDLIPTCCLHPQQIKSLSFVKICTTRTGGISLGSVITLPKPFDRKHLTLDKFNISNLNAYVSLLELQSGQRQAFILTSNKNLKARCLLKLSNLKSQSNVNEQKTNKKKHRWTKLEQYYHRNCKYKFAKINQYLAYCVILVIVPNWLIQMTPIDKDREKTGC